MKIRIQLCFFLIAQVFSVQSQQFNWATSVTGEKYEYGVKSVKDAQGNTYFIGFNTGNHFEFNGVSHTTNGKGDAFFAKLDINKALVWMKPIGGDDAIYSDWAEDIHIDPFGDIYITLGSCGNNFTYDGQVLSGINSPGQYSGEAVLLKVNSNGDYIWHDSGSVSSHFNAIATDLEGNVYITGTFSSSMTLGGAITLANLSTGTTHDLFVAKYQPNGTILWAKHAGGLPHNTFAYGLDVEINPQTGEVIVLGKAEGSVYFDGVPVPVNGGPDKAIVLISYDTSGNQNWVKQILDVQDDAFSTCRSLAISVSGILGVCGQTYTQGLVGFYNSDGSVISEHAYPSPNALRMYSIVFNEFNDAYLSGFCTGGGTLGISPGTAVISATTGFITKMDVYQQVKWVGQFYSSISSNQIDYRNGTISYAGRIDGPFSYNAGQNIIINNLGDALFGEVADNQLLNTESHLTESCIVYPNPTSGILTIEANALKKIEIYNVNGMLLRCTDAHQVNLSEYPGGIYFLKIVTENGATSKKIVLK